MTLAICSGKEGAWHPLERRDAAWLAVLAADFRLRHRAMHSLVEAGVTVALHADVKVLDGDALWLTAFHYDDCEAFAGWLGQLRERQRSRRRETLTAAAARHEARGELARALELAEALVADEPLSEHALRRLMRLHYLRGDRAAAIQGFERFEQRLKHELGARPDPETLALLESIEYSTPVAPLRRVALPATLLCPPRLIGRDAQLREVLLAWEAGRVGILGSDAPGSSDTPVRIRGITLD